MPTMNERIGAENVEMLEAGGLGEDRDRARTRFHSSFLDQQRDHSQMTFGM